MHERRLPSLGRLLTATCAVLAQTAFAQPLLRSYWYSVHEFRTGGSYTQDVHARFEIRERAGVEVLENYVIPYSRKYESAEVVEAHVLKADGRRLKMPGRRWHYADHGETPSQSLFSDREGLVVELPALAVGDAVSLHHRIRSLKPVMPGKFALQLRLPPLAAGEDVRVIVRVPGGIPHSVETQGMESRESIAGFMRIHEWTQRRAPGDAALVRVSNFRSYGELALAYGTHASSRALPTRRIRSLAAEIVGGETRPREKARLLYGWVSTRLHGIGDCTRPGETFPNATDQVLDKLFAGCRDHATVLQALLAAVSIESEQVLLGADGEDELPAIPMPAALGQAILYIPAWNMYADASEPGLAIGELAPHRQSRPAIHVRRKPFSTSTPVTPR